MEIEIPDLQDLEFEKTCYSCYLGRRENCKWCHGAGLTTTQVGLKLIEFLEKRGVDIVRLERDK